LENLATLTQLDFFLTLGNITAQTPLQLNGQPFSIKLGVLENKRSRHELVGGMAQNNRVERRDYRQ
jgi:hypothetical protein